MCRDKGLDTLVDAFIRLRKSGKSGPVKLKIGGSCGPSDQPVVEELKARLAKAELLADTEFHPNLTREQKIDFLKSLTVFSVPARYGEAFGLYLVEAMAAGVPVVQPRTAAFPEILELTGGGLLCEPESPQALAGELERVITDPPLQRQLAEAGRKSAQEHFSADAAARMTLKAFAEA
jgi:glycosyltransferase involved in cell wall biosynthesis